MSKTHSKNLTKDMWSAELLRISVFAKDINKKVGKTDWLNVVGEKPEQIQENPRQGIVRHIGAFGDNALHLNIFTDHIEWLYVPNIVEPPQGPPNVGVLSEARKFFVPKIQDWITKSKLEGVTRTAYAGQLFKVAKSNLDALNYIGSTVDEINISDPENATNVQFTLNRKRNSNVISNLQINQITTWMSNEVHFFGGTVFPESNLPLKGEVIYIAGLNFDYNNKPCNTGESIPTAKLRPFHEELVSYADHLTLGV